MSNRKPYFKKLFCIALAVCLLIFSLSNLVACGNSSRSDNANGGGNENGGNSGNNSTATVIANDLVESYRAAKENGYAGTLDDWADLIGVLMGKDGKSAYDVAVDNGFVGTQSEWLESLKGADGKDGKDGKDGSVVIDGDDIDNIASSAEKLKRSINDCLLSTVSILTTITYTTGTIRPQTQTLTSAGSGFIYDNGGELKKSNGDCYIITNAHVIMEQAHLFTSISVNFYGMEYTENAVNLTQDDLIGYSASQDIAVLRIKGSEIYKNCASKPVKVADYYSYDVGDSCFAIGNALANGIAAVDGIISKDNDNITLELANAKTYTMRLLRTSVPINSGNSGGGLFNNDGELIGVVNSKNTQTNTQNIAYAIPAKAAIGCANNIIRNYASNPTSVNALDRRPIVALFGVTYNIIDSSNAVDPDTGMTVIKETIAVSAVTAGSVSYGKLKVDDVLLSVTAGGETLNITRLWQFNEFAYDLILNDTATLNVLRDGKETTVEIKMTKSTVKE